MTGENSGETLGLTHGLTADEWMKALNGEDHFADQLAEYMRKDGAYGTPDSDGYACVDGRAPRTEYQPRVRTPRMLQNERDASFFTGLAMTELEDLVEFVRTPDNDALAAQQAQAARQRAASAQAQHTQ